MNYTYYPYYIRFDQIPVFNFCTTRIGGISLWPFESCNAGFNTPDKPEHIKYNRFIISSRTKIPLENFVFLKQVHKGTVVYIDRDQCGKSLQEPVLEGDGMFTDYNGICLAITLADCVGIAIYDPKKHIAGICHSGWKGTLLNICGKLVEKMVETGGCATENLLVSLSPAICYRCYEISCELAEKFSTKYASFVKKIRKKYHLDMKGIITSQLVEKGVRKGNIFDSSICTSENTHIFYSHRAEKNTGRFIFGIYLQT